MKYIAYKSRGGGAIFMLISGVIIYFFGLEQHDWVNDHRNKTGLGETAL